MNLKYQCNTVIPDLHILHFGENVRICRSRDPWANILALAYGALLSQG